MREVIQYRPPQSWLLYDASAIAQALAEAKAAIIALTSIPYQRDWLVELQQIELKREVAGTSRIEGAEFTDAELDDAMSGSADELFTRSQRQARAALETYRWITQIPGDKPIDAELVLGIHRRIVHDCDDDHCVPGAIRSQDENVLFGHPRHRGANGGQECRDAFETFSRALETIFRDHDPIVRALAAHYHIAAMHPFLDGNGRTARALEALMLQRAGLKDICFISMSNYYYEEKAAYLKTLSAVRAADHDLTPFLLFAMKGIVLQCTRILRIIRVHLQKALFRDMMLDLFGRLKSPKRRVIAQRQIQILKVLLTEESMEEEALYNRVYSGYSKLKHPVFAFYRDLFDLIHIKAIRDNRGNPGEYRVWIRLEWPTEITETDFFERMKHLPKAKT